MHRRDYTGTASFVNYINNILYSILNGDKNNNNIYINIYFS